MNRLFNKTFIFLLCVPFAFYLTGWQWQGPNSLPHNITTFLWFITETGSFPYAIVSSLFLGTLLWQLAGQKKKIIILIALSIALTQVTMTTMKWFFSSPRPFITIMHNADKAAIKQFYTLNEAGRVEKVRQYYIKTNNPPEVLKNHHIKSAQYSFYSFPSGHTIFVSTWALLFAGLIRNRRGKITTMLVTSWAMIVMASRVWLGMHYPIDLAASVGLATIINFVLLKYFLRKKL